MELAALVACGSEGHGVLPVSASEATTPAFPAVDRSVLPKVMELVSTAPTPPSATQVAAIIASFVTCILRCLLVGSKCPGYEKDELRRNFKTGKYGKARLRHYFAL
ncbi:hypothetical protein PF007_g4139 [Phytophthora fragariae]|uniref:Uncharacterized protein n=1 Tax=Phytophthora fragariae TaxID=53985 RepID=A0A6A3T858_9STRA|nr:hypothetical protein PF009_g3788 [Phytophthora fragariae]KAE9131459.1 hypothetical protein PF007_g4139 [Phytophthora fragariae]KAE9321994.1 hypothetical protein PF001_g4628 [Phytophthora fragariae]